MSGRKKKKEDNKRIDKVQEKAKGKNKGLIVRFKVRKEGRRLRGLTIIPSN